MDNKTTLLMQTRLFDDGDPDSPDQPQTPILSSILSLNSIRNHLGATAFSRGRNYQEKGRVSDLYISPSQTSITATVEGSRAEPYHQNITLIPSQNGGGVQIKGLCTCPLGGNCKHVAAVLLEALSKTRSAAPKPPKPAPIPVPTAPLPPPLPPALPLPYEVRTWLDQFAQSADGDGYPPEISQRLLYLINSRETANSAPHLAVEIICARLLKSGSFSNSISRPALYNSYAGDFPRYFRQSDVEICQSLLESRGGYNHSFYSIKSFNLLKSIVETGRAYWLNQHGEPLRMGETRQGQIEWIMPDTKGMRPVLKVEGAISLNAEPPVYVDAEQSLIGEVSLPLPRQLSHRLLNAPAIAPAHVEQVSRTLGRHLPAGANLVPKPPAPAIVVNEAPTPVLRLMLIKNAVGQYNRAASSDLPVARLAFRYGPIDVPLSETRPVVEALHENQLYQARRHPSREKQALDKLRFLELRFAREFFGLISPAHFHDLAFADPYFWLDFLAKDVPILQEQGFGIRIDDDFPYRLAKPVGDLDTEVFESSNVDWFELGLGVQVDGEPLDLAPYLANLVMTHGLEPDAIAELAESDDDFYIPMKDGRHLALAAKRFLPVILALHELTVGGAVIGKNGRLRMSKAETALLSSLQNQEGVAFKGSQNLRNLVRTLNSSGAEATSHVTLPATFKATLRPYQSQGVAWLNLLREAGLGGILADDMGLGKTVQILAILALEKAEGRLDKPALIVAPTSLMTNWQNEARRFGPDLNVLVLHGAARKQRFSEIEKNDIVLTTYPLIARDHAVLMEQQWHMAILDEAQTIKNPNAATTQLIRDLKTKHRFCLTGTPMENHLGELWSLMTFVNPGYLGDKSGFSRNWRTPIEKHSDSERSDILARRVKPFLLRRTKREVASELPPKSEITESVILDDKQRDLYDSIRLSMHKKVRDAIAAKGFSKSHIIILEALLKLRQVCCDPRLLKIAGVRDAKSAPPSAKLGRLMEMLESLLAEGRKIIVFSQFTSMLHLIREKIEQLKIPFSVLTGETRDRKREIEQFQGGATDIFLVSLKAGGVGLNLTAADTVILYDPWWNPAVEEQAIDRAYRIGQDKPVFVYRLVASQTIEEKMDQLKARKRALAESILQQAGKPAAALTEEDLQALFEPF